MFMTTETFIGKLVEEILQRPGETRDTLAAKLGLKPPEISNIKKGRQSLADEKIPLLASIHNNVSAEEIRVRKHAEWIEREKGIKMADFIAIFQNSITRSDARAA